MLKVGDVVVSAYNEWFQYKVVKVNSPTSVDVRGHAFRTDAGAAAWDGTPEELQEHLDDDSPFTCPMHFFTRVEDLV